MMSTVMLREEDYLKELENSFNRELAAEICASDFEFPSDEVLRARARAQRERRAFRAWRALQRKAVRANVGVRLRTPSRRKVQRRRRTRRLPKRRGLSRRPTRGDPAPDPAPGPRPASKTEGSRSRRDKNLEKQGGSEADDCDLPMGGSR